MPEAFDKQDLQNFKKVQRVNYVYCECNKATTEQKFQSLFPHCVEKSLEAPDYLQKAE